jgi:hypothetical protein
MTVIGTRCPAPWKSIPRIASSKLLPNKLTVTDAAALRIWSLAAMTGRISMSARRELVAAVAVRYRNVERDEKGRVLDEQTAVIGWHRKHAVRALSAHGKGAKRRRRRQPTYGEAIRDALIALWEASDGVCGKRLKVMIPVLLPSLERHDRLNLGPTDRNLMLTISAATSDRMLSNVAARHEVAVDGARASHLPEVREAQAQLGARVDRRPRSTIRLSAEAQPVASFAGGLGKNWEAGERLTIHRRPYVRRKPLPTRPSMLDPYVVTSRHGSLPNRTSHPLPLWIDFATAHQIALAISNYVHCSGSCSRPQNGKKTM